MSLIDKAKEFLGKNSEQANKGIDKAGDIAKNKIPGKDGQIDNIVDKAKGVGGNQG